MDDEPELMVEVLLLVKPFMGDCVRRRFVEGW